MAVKRVCLMGEPILSKAAEPIAQFGTDELYALIQDMQDTMIAYDGAGIAAPQIGVGLRVMMFGIEKNPRYPRAEQVPMTTLINPELEPLDDTTSDDWEGCLSVPKLRGKVERYHHIRYWGFDPEGNKIEREAKGFHARVVQHELDHLNGILFPYRLNDIRNLVYEEALQQRLGTL